MPRCMETESKARRLAVLAIAGSAFLLSIAWGAFAPLPAQQAAPPKQAKGAPIPRPPLFFKVEWKQPKYAGELTDTKRWVTPEAVGNPDLELKIYGPCKDGGVEVYGAPGDVVVPMNLWTGMCASPVAVTPRDKNNYVDLSGSARIRWITRAANLHAVRPVLKLADGTLIVGNHTDVTPNAPGQYEPEMLQTEFAIGATSWYKLDPEKISTNRPADNPDFSKVDEVGFADLMPGGGHGSAGWINVGPWEVFGKAVKR